MNAPALLSLVVMPNTRADYEKLRHGLAKLTAEDPMLRAGTDHMTGLVVISGMSELHLATIMERLRRDFQVEASFGPPQVVYREALTRPADGEAKYASWTAGRGHYGHVKIHLFPGEPGSGYVFENKLVRGTIPKEFVNPIDEGINAARTGGVLAGYPVDDVRIELYDGSYHSVESSDTAFRTAGAMAFQNAAKQAGPVLLEPVMRVQVVVHEEHLANVAANLSSRRGRIESQEVREGMPVIQARVPLAEMFGYAVDLHERTRGQGTFGMEFDHYQPCRSAEDDEGRRDSLVAAPRKPPPTLRQSHIALPEPDGDNPGG